MINVDQTIYFFHAYTYFPYFILLFLLAAANQKISEKCKLSTHHLVVLFGWRSLFQFIRKIQVKLTLWFSI